MGQELLSMTLQTTSAHEASAREAKRMKQSQCAAKAAEQKLNTRFEDRLQKPFNRCAFHGRDSVHHVT